MKRLNFVLPPLIAVLAGAMTPPANAQETNSPPGNNSLSVEALVAEALAKNPELKFYEAEIAAAGSYKAGSEGVVNVRALKPGRYEFFDDFNDKARGALTVQ